VDADGTTAFTYDLWGRTISKVRGGYSAYYEWRFGDKLKNYNTNFPGETDAAYNYDGLGRRRVKLLNYTGSYTEADATWYRYGAGWDATGEYASADVDNWVPGAAERTYVGQGAYIDGATPSSGTYTYLTHDHLGSVRGGWSAGKDSALRVERRQHIRHL